MSERPYPRCGCQVAKTCGIHQWAAMGLAEMQQTERYTRRPGCPIKKAELIERLHAYRPSNATSSETPFGEVWICKNPDDREAQLACSHFIEQEDPDYDPYL